MLKSNIRASQRAYTSLYPGLDGEVYARFLTELLLLGSSFKQFVWMWLFPSQSETTKVVLVTIRLLNRHQHKFSRLSFQTTKCHPEPKCVILSAAKDLAPASAFPCYIPHLSSCYSTCHPVIPLVILSAAKDLTPALAGFPAIQIKNQRVNAVQSSTSRVYFLYLKLTRFQ